MTFTRRLFLPSLMCMLFLVSDNLTAREKEKPVKQQQTTEQDGKNNQIAPHLLIVKMRAAASYAVQGTSFGVESLDAVLKRIDATSVAPFYHDVSALSKGGPSVEAASIARLYRIVYSQPINPSVLAKEIGADPSVEYAEPYYIFPLSYTPNDPRISQQYAIAMLKLPEAWDVTKGDSTIIIGDVDTGIDWNHEDLRNAVYINKGEWGVNGELSNNGKDDDLNGLVDDYHGWDFIGTGTAQSPLPDNNPMDGVLGHGTNTASCAAATTDNGLGIAGTSFRSKVLPVKVAGDNSTGIADGYNGILYAANMGCKVINCSWGSTGAYSQAMQDIINFANSKGALVVSSSGNNPIDNDRIPEWPSSYNHVLAVGSVEPSGAVSNWATYGTSVHVYAPGKTIWMAKKGGGYVSGDGTSFSSPITAGIAALVFSVHPDWTPDQVAAQLRVTSDAFDSPPQPERYGRVNAYKAVTVNNTLSDIPGIRMKNATITTASGDRLTAPGMTARIDMTLENVLAPTTAAAMASVEFEDTTLSTNAAPIALGVIQTNATKNISFDVTLTDFPISSEQYQPVRIKITDGNYVDYVMTRILVYLDKGWHTALVTNTAAFSSIDVNSPQNIWATIDVTQNSAPVADYCFRTADGGASWYYAHGTGFPTGKGVYCVRALSVNAALIGTGPQNGAAEICRTANGGQSWTASSVSSMTPFVDAIHMFDASNGLFIGDPKNGIWGLGKTTDGGSTWAPVAKPVSAPGTEAGWNNGYDFIGDIGWFGTNNSKIYKTTDRGETWKAYATPSQHSPDISFRDALVGAIRFSVQNSSGSNALAVTTDGGETWTPVTSMAMTQFGSIVMERGGTRLWLLRDGNAYITRDLGKTWTVEPRPDGFDPLTVTDMIADGSQAYVWAAGLNVYRFVSPLEKMTGIGTSTPRPESIIIHRISPNPAGSRMSPIIEFSIPSTSQTELSVWDNAGHRVKTVFDAILTAGHHTSYIDVSALSSGTYYCRITADGRSEVRSLVVSR